MTYNITPRDELIWYAVDLDGTLAEPVWPDPGIGRPIHRNIDKLEELVSAGKKIVIHTSRPSSDFELIESWLIHYHVPFDRIVTGKELAHRYIDDKAVHESMPSWL